MKTWTRSILALAGALALAGVSDAQIAAPNPGPTSDPLVSKTEIRHALMPSNPDSPNDANDPGNAGEKNPNRQGESLDHRYRWSYSRTDPKTGLPLELPHEDMRRGEIDDFRKDCLDLVSTMDISNGGPPKIPRSQIENLEDQWAVMVLACVNHLHIQRTRGMRGIGAIMCQSATGQCWGPSTVWAPRPTILSR